MKRFMIVALSLPAVLAFATPLDDLRGELRSVEAQIRARRETVIESEQATVLRVKTQEAEQAYRGAVSALPAVQEVDKRLAAIRDEVEQLCQQRRQIETTSPELVEARKARDEARAAFRAAMDGDTQLSQLMSRHEELAMRLNELERAPAPAQGQ